jgi:hypothetical protein
MPHKASRGSLPRGFCRLWAVVVHTKNQSWGEIMSTRAMSSQLSVILGSLVVAITAATDEERDAFWEGVREAGVVPQPSRPTTLKEALTTIDSWVDTLDYAAAEQLWQVLAAIRGPDDNNENVKYLTTAVIRNLALPRLAKEVYVAVNGDASSFDDSDANGHFADHVRWAWGALIKNGMAPLSVATVRSLADQSIYSAMCAIGNRLDALRDDELREMVKAVHDSVNH